MSSFPGSDDVIHDVAGIRIATVSAGLYDSDRQDLALVEINNGAHTAAVFTSNKFSAAPVIVAKQHLARSSPLYLLINTGNANAGTGQKGHDSCVATCQAVAAQTTCSQQEVLPFSTGVIGEYLPEEKIIGKIPELFSTLETDRWSDLATAIMTTDTKVKISSSQIELDGQMISITGVAKGSGMIKPDMATMLAYIATDARIAKETLSDILTTSVNSSFNRICVDGDTSTNDACVLIATGEAGSEEITESHPAYKDILTAIQAVCTELAQAIVRDGEGATKFVTIKVKGGSSEEGCLQLATLLATSSLVKTALYASDPNWGRILAVIGRSDLADLDINQVHVSINSIPIVVQGERSAQYTEEQGQQAMQQDDLVIDIDLGIGTSSCVIWTCDLSHDYVTINAEYRT